MTLLIGSAPDDLLWDQAHRLQGHGHVQGQELVVIAARDDDHQTVVLFAHDWDAVRRASTDTRRALLDECSIVHRNQLTNSDIAA